MLDTIGVGSISELLAGIPAGLRAPADYPFPPRLSHPELLAHMRALAAKNAPLLDRPSFLGAGAYRHFVPPVVDVARLCLERAHEAAARIAAIPGFAPRFPGAPFFKEFAMRCPRPAAEVGRALARRGIAGGLDVGRFLPEETDVMLFCVTELNPPDDIARLVAALEEIR